MAHLDLPGGEQPASAEEYNITTTYRFRTHHPISSTATLQATIKNQAQKLSNQVLNAIRPDAEIGVNVVRKAAKQSLKVGSTRPSRRNGLQHDSDTYNPPTKKSGRKEDNPVGWSKDDPAPNSEPEYPQAAQNGFQSHRKEDSPTIRLLNRRRSKTWRSKTQQKRNVLHQRFSVGKSHATGDRFCLIANDSNSPLSEPHQVFIEPE
ncbi:hypothetical protein LTR37_019422 [Vermiconidia calcicola]|uniref:Uncharacterized protein n=1 Tax=Vermiconidia calcicola TaxID=1690605 RepID=A0ACC3ME83_9PEZI|nr:hypothetical protein LTR37_019422 [Vermiconidia calcicola]